MGIVYVAAYRKKQKTMNGFALRSPSESSDRMDWLASGLTLLRREGRKETFCECKIIELLITLSEMKSCPTTENVSHSVLMAVPVPVPLAALLWRMIFRIKMLALESGKNGKTIDSECVPVCACCVVVCACVCGGGGGVVRCCVLLRSCCAVVA